MFLAMLPISKTGGSAVDISAIIHFLYPKLDSFFNMEYYMYLLTGTRNSQALYRTKDKCNCGMQTKQPHVSISFIRNIGYSSKRNVSATQQIVWVGSLNTQIAWAVRRLHLLQTPINCGTSPFKIPPLLYI